MGHCVSEVACLKQIYCYRDDLTSRPVALSLSPRVCLLLKSVLSIKGFFFYVLWMGTYEEYMPCDCTKARARPTQVFWAIRMVVKVGLRLFRTIPFLFFYLRRTADKKWRLMRQRKPNLLIQIYFIYIYFIFWL